MKIRELKRLAFYYAEQDRRALADCYAENTPEHKEALELANKFKEYRLKHYGRALGDDLADKEYCNDKMVELKDFINKK